ncbi:MAG: hypothetical protein ACJ8GK_12420 [Luteimonas sp.]
MALSGCVVACRWQGHVIAPPREERMYRHVMNGFMALAMAILAWGCASSFHGGNTANAERDALVQRTQAYERDARQAPDRMSPQRKAELQQLATDVAAWQARTGRDDIRVTEQRQTSARRVNEGGGSGNCENDCPVYTFKNDEICFLKGSECTSDPEHLGTYCIYECISIRSDVSSGLSKGQ